MDTERAKEGWGHGALTAWVILTLVLAVVVWKLWDQSNKIQKRTDENRALITQVRNQGVSIQQLQHEATASCANYLHPRHAVNKFHSSLSGLLLIAEKARTASYRRSHHRSDLQAIRSYKKLRKNLLTVKQTCAQRRN
jgi:hypothetical protein